MSFDNYASSSPDAVDMLEITLLLKVESHPPRPDVGDPGGPDTIEKSGSYRFRLVGPEGVVEVRAGDLADHLAMLATTTISMPALSAWLDEMHAKAQDVLP